MNTLAYYEYFSFSYHVIITQISLISHYFISTLMFATELAR